MKPAGLHLEGLLLFAVTNNVNSFVVVGIRRTAASLHRTLDSAYGTVIRVRARRNLHFGNCPVLSRIGEVEGTLTVAAVMPGGWGKRLGFSSIAITAAQKEPPAGREPRRAFPEVTDFGLRASCVSELAARDDLAQVELRAERDALGEGDRAGAILVEIDLDGLGRLVARLFLHFELPEQ